MQRTILGPAHLHVIFRRTILSQLSIYNIAHACLCSKLGTATDDAASTPCSGGEEIGAAKKTWAPTLVGKSLLATSAAHTCYFLVAAAQSSPGSLIDLSKSPNHFPAGFPADVASASENARTNRICLPDFLQIHAFFYICPTGGAGRCCRDPVATKRRTWC